MTFDKFMQTIFDNAESHMRMIELFEEFMNIDVNKLYQEYAQSLAKSPDELSEEDKKQAFMNRVLGKKE
jgi:hypothetical protein